MIQTRYTPTLARAIAIGGMALLSVLRPLPAFASPGAEAAALRMDVDRGELMSIISIAPKPGSGAAQARAQYLRTAFALSSEYGLRPLGNLSVSEVIIGKFSPAAVAFYAWPSAETEARFNEDLRWAPIRSTRPDGWDELRIHDVVSDKAQSLVFSKDKFYTLATAWIDPEQPEDYESYLSRIDPAVTAAGGRFVFEMIRPAFTSLIEATGTPSRLTIVEWEERDSLDAFLASKAFAQYSPLLYSGTQAFELLGLMVPAD